MMNIGCFSVSLSVKDLKKSKMFYEHLGFHVYAGELAHNFLIMKNGKTNIGLFQGMFEENILTFNPGWDQDAKNTDSFTDVRDIQEKLIAQGLTITQSAINDATGPASFSIQDPDGNSILFDQHR